MNRILWSALVALVLTVLATGCDKTGAGKAPAGTTNALERTSEMTFNRANFALLVAHPDRYQGARVDIVGKVVGVERDVLGAAIQLYADPINDDWLTVVYSSAGTVVTVDDYARDKYVRVIGVVDPAFTGKALGTTVTAPSIVAYEVRPSSARMAGR